MGSLRSARRRLLRTHRDVEEIKVELEKYGLEEDVAKAKALGRLKDLEATLRARRPSPG